MSDAPERAAAPGAGRNPQHFTANREKRGVVLLSGGLDSMLVLALGKLYKWEMVTLFVDYGQRAVERERDASGNISSHYDADRVVCKVQLPTWHSLLTDGEPGVPETLEEIRESGKSPYIVPGRNAVFLSLAASLAQTRGMRSVFIGCNLQDQLGFPDCRLDWLESLDLGVSIRVPLGQMPKVEVCRTLQNLKAPIDWSSTCYYATDARRACGRCDACMLRNQAFDQC